MTADHNDDIYTKASFAGFFDLRTVSELRRTFYLIMSDIYQNAHMGEDESAVLDRYPGTGDPSLYPAGGTHGVLGVSEEVGCFALREQGGFIVAMRHAIWLADTWIIAARV